MNNLFTETIKMVLSGLQRAQELQHELPHYLTEEIILFTVRGCEPKPAAAVYKTQAPSPLPLSLPLVGRFMTCV